MRFDKPLKVMRPAALTRSGIPKIEIVKKPLHLATVLNYAVSTSTKPWMCAPQFEQIASIQIHE